MATILRFRLVAVCAVRQHSYASENIVLYAKLNKTTTLNIATLCVLKDKNLTVSNSNKTKK